MSLYGNCFVRKAKDITEKTVKIQAFYNGTGIYGRDFPLLCKTKTTT